MKVFIKVTKVTMMMTTMIAVMAMAMAMVVIAVLMKGLMMLVKANKVVLCHGI